MSEQQGTPSGPRVPTVEELGRTAPDLELAACTEMLDPSLRTTLEARYEPGPDSARLRIRRSWIWVDYVGNVVGQAGRRWLLEGVATELTAANSVVELGRYGFETFAVREDRTSGDVEDLYRWVIDEHAGPVLRAASAESKVGLRNLWGSVAAALVGSTIETCRRLGAPVPVDRVTAFMDGRPELAGKGELVWLDDADPAGYHRDTCCLWFRVDIGEKCEDCVLCTREEVLASLRTPREAAEPA